MTLGQQLNPKVFYWDLSIGAIVLSRAINNVVLTDTYSLHIQGLTTNIVLKISLQDAVSFNPGKDDEFATISVHEVAIW